MKGNMIGEWVKTVFRITAGSPKNLNDRFAKSCSKVRNMKQKTVLPASRFWSRKSIWVFFIGFCIIIPPQVSFSEDAEKPSVAPHLIPGFRNYFAEDSYQLQDLAYHNGSPEASLSPKNLPAPQHYRQLQEVFLLDAEPAQKPGTKTPRATPSLAVSRFPITTTLKTTSTSVS